MWSGVRCLYLIPLWRPPVRTTALEDITFRRQLGVLPAQPGQLRPLILTQRTTAIAAAALVRVRLPVTTAVEPVAQLLAG
jgi:hypothetical protein